MLKRYQHPRDNLLLLLEDVTVPLTNNLSEQSLRLIVVFRKVTHSFLSDWGLELFAQVRSLGNTANRQSISAFKVIARALNSHQTDWLLS